MSVDEEWIESMERRRRFMRRYRWLYRIHEWFETRCSLHCGLVFSGETVTPLREWLFRFCGDTEFFLRGTIKLVTKDRP